MFYIYIYIDRGFESHRRHGYLSVECRVLSGRGLCDELITRPEESYRLWCVVVCDLETSRIGAPYIYNISCIRANTSAHCSGRNRLRFKSAELGRYKCEAVFVVTTPHNFLKIRRTFKNYMKEPKIWIG